MNYKDEDMLLEMWLEQQRERKERNNRQEHVTGGY